MRSPTAELIEWLGSVDPSFEAHHNVPARRPCRFQTVSQVGGSRSNRIETASLAVQAWAGTWEQAESDARAIAGAVETAPGFPGSIQTARVQNIVPFPSEEGVPRWQVTVSATCLIS